MKNCGGCRSTDFHVDVPPDQTDSFLSKGFEKGAVLVRLSRAPIETKMMPILPLMNPTKKEIPTIIELDVRGITKTKGAYADAQATENVIRNIMSGNWGLHFRCLFREWRFPEPCECMSSYQSISRRSQCLASVYASTLQSAGLATTEIASAMNRLVKEGKGVTRLTVWSPETNEVMKRLLEKMGFIEDREQCEMTAKI